MPAPRSETPRRINVAVNAQMLAAIDAVIETDDVTLTEAVRRLIGYGELVHRTTRVEHGRVFVEIDGTMREVHVV